MQLKVLGMKLRLEVIVVCMLLGGFIAVNLWCTCAGGIKEGFDAGMQMTNAAFQYTVGKDGKKHVDLYKHLEGNRGGKVPPPKHEKFLFEHNEFKPECCPSTYSSSRGCACVSPEQAKYINERGGNRTGATIW